MQNIEKLQDGKKGSVFKVTGDDGHVSVIKLQGESPAQAIVGTAMLMKAGVDAPPIRPVKDDNLSDLQEEVNEFIKNAQAEGQEVDVAAAQQLAECLEQAANPDSKYKFPNVVEMDFVNGVELGKAIAQDNFKSLLTNPAFQAQLGQLMAADAFVGNGDRINARSPNKKKAGPEVLEGWYNPANLIIEGQGPNVKLKAIDNDFTPGVNLTMGKLFGGEVGGGGGQWASLAAANPAQFKREIFAVVQYLEKQSGVQLSPQELKDFIEVATGSAKASMDVMLDQGYTAEGVSQMLRTAGASESSCAELSEGFEENSKMLSLVAGSMEKEVSVKPTVAEMMKIAKTPGELNAEKVLIGIGLSPEEAKEIAGDREKLQRFNKLMEGKKGAHVPEGFKPTVKEAALIAKDESIYKQFTQQKPGFKH